MNKKKNTIRSKLRQEGYSLIEVIMVSSFIILITLAVSQNLHLAGFHSRYVHKQFGISKEIRSFSQRIKRDTREGLRIDVVDSNNTLLIETDPEHTVGDSSDDVRVQYRFSPNNNNISLVVGDAATVIVNDVFPYANTPIFEKMGDNVLIINFRCQDQAGNDGQQYTDVSDMVLRLRM